MADKKVLKGSDVVLDCVAGKRKFQVTADNFNTVNFKGVEVKGIEYYVKKAASYGATKAK